MHAAHPATVRDDFDAIARLSDRHGSGSDRYDAFLAAQVPARAVRVLDIGCGLGRLAARVVAPGREVIGVDLSPEMTRGRALWAPERPGSASNAPTSSTSTRARNGSTVCSPRPCSITWMPTPRSRA
jgi:SAM-dependent methyltransferase